MAIVIQRWLEKAKEEGSDYDKKFKHAGTLLQQLDKKQNNSLWGKFTRVVRRWTGSDHIESAQIAFNSKTAHIVMKKFGKLQDIVKQPVKDLNELEARTKQLDEFRVEISHTLTNTIDQTDSITNIKETLLDQTIWKKALIENDHDDPLIKKIKEMYVEIRKAKKNVELKALIERNKLKLEEIVDRSNSATTILHFEGLLQDANKLGITLAEIISEYAKDEIIEADLKNGLNELSKEIEEQQKQFEAAINFKKR
ncbi:MAG: hypothetical protein K0S74_1488 [Chlamydiales bacterium]|jgi:hypothetical protein|nr:hypothetical protein [Chlamydiales bacterium]